MRHRSRTGGRFWQLYFELPPDIREIADKQYVLFEQDPNHPSLRLKRVGAFWSVRVSLGYRAVARWRDDRFVWFWIGPHNQYDRLLKTIKF